MQIVLDNISKFYGPNKILNKLSMTFVPGNITTIVGGNGVGKTTLLNIINGFVKPDNGVVLLNGEALKTTKEFKIARNGVGRLFQELRVFDSMSALENVIVGFKNQVGENPIAGLFLRHRVKKDQEKHIQKARELLKLVSFEEDENKYPPMLSYGKCRLLSFAILLSTDPSLLLLDEPSAGLSPENEVKMVDLLKSFKTTGKTIIIVEHNKNFIESISDHIMMIKNGNINKL